eukprot:3679257-Pyramimonas_sp.AAC.1
MEHRDKLQQQLITVSHLVKDNPFLSDAMAELTKKLQDENAKLEAQTHVCVNSNSTLCNTPLGAHPHRVACGASIPLMGLRVRTLLLTTTADGASRGDPRRRGAHRGRRAGGVAAGGRGGHLPAWIRNPGVDRRPPERTQPHRRYSRTSQEQANIREYLIHYDGIGHPCNKKPTLIINPRLKTLGLL